MYVPSAKIENCKSQSQPSDLDNLNMAMVHCSVIHSIVTNASENLQMS